MTKAGVGIFGLDRFRGLSSGPNVLGALMLVVVAGPGMLARGSNAWTWMLAAMIATALASTCSRTRVQLRRDGVGGGLFVIWKWRLRGVLCAQGDWPLRCW